MPGLDGRKMSKSYGNTIGLTEDPESIARKIKAMTTDPARVRRTDPGNPEKCPVWDLHKLYSADETRAWVQQGCTTAGIGCLDCKKPVIEKIWPNATVMRERAAPYLENPGRVREILRRRRAPRQRCGGSNHAGRARRHEPFRPGRRPP